MSKQYKAFLIDLFIVTLFIMPIIIWFLITPSISSYTKWESRFYQDLWFFFNTSFFLAYFTIIQVYLIIKDVLNLSVGKRKYNLKIIDRKTGKEAHWLKKILRNLTFLVPLLILLEFVFKIITPKARFGDMIFDTEIRESSKVIRD